MAKLLTRCWLGILWMRSGSMQAISLLPGVFSLFDLTSYGCATLIRYYHDSVEVLLESEPITLFCTKQTENVLSF